MSIHFVRSRERIKRQHKSLGLVSTTSSHKYFLSLAFTGQQRFRQILRLMLKLTGYAQLCTRISKESSETFTNSDLPASFDNCQLGLLLLFISIHVY